MLILIFLGLPALSLLYQLYAFGVKSDTLTHDGRKIALLSFVVTVVLIAQNLWVASNGSRTVLPVVLSVALLIVHAALARQWQFSELTKPQKLSVLSLYVSLLLAAIAWLAVALGVLK